MRILSPAGATAGSSSELPAPTRRVAPFVLDALAALAALLVLRVGALLLTPDGAASRPGAAIALGCATAALLGGLTAARVCRARRTLVVAWAPVLLWPLAGPPAVAAPLAVLGCAGVLAIAVRVRWGALLALAAAAVLVIAVQHPGVGDRVATTAAIPGIAPVPRDGPPTAAPPAGAPPPSAEHAVRAYYRALDARRFDRAWSVLSRGVRSSFGGAARWRAGFATTRASRPSQLRVSLVGGATTVRHVLTATDRTPCGGVVVRRYAVTWTLRNRGGRWQAAALAGRLLGDVRRSPACGPPSG